MREKEIRTICSPSIKNKQLVAEDWTIMTNEICERECLCVKKDTCLWLLNLLSRWRVKEAKEKQKKLKK